MEFDYDFEPIPIELSENYTPPLRFIYIFIDFQNKSFEKNSDRLYIIIKFSYNK